MMCPPTFTEDDSETMMAICDMPDEALASISNFLPMVSVLCFAAATRPRSSPASNAIIASLEDHQLEELNFFHAGADLAQKLTDDDLSAILISMNAIHGLKKLKLTGCVNVTGRGMEPLMGSVVLEQVNLDSDKQRRGERQGRISESEVLPILDSIVEQEGNSLKHLHLPIEWFSNSVDSTALHQFLTRYSQLLSSRSFNCLNCDGRDAHNDDDDDLYECWAPLEGESWYPPMRLSLCSSPTQKFTCYSCVKNRCDNDFASEISLRVCMTCSRKYCQTCDLKECWECQCNTCSECIVECEGCGTGQCNLCFGRCDYCNQVKCDDCSNPYKSLLEIFRHDLRGCKKEYPISQSNEKCTCFSCLLPLCRRSLEKGKHVCAGCATEHFPKIFLDSMEIMLRALNEHFERRNQRGAGNELLQNELTTYG